MIEIFSRVCEIKDRTIKKKYTDKSDIVLELYSEDEKKKINFSSGNDMVSDKWNKSLDKVIVVTGTLGSGKTYVLKEISNFYESQKHQKVITLWLDCKKISTNEPIEVSILKQNFDNDRDVTINDIQSLLTKPTEEGKVILFADDYGFHADENLEKIFSLHNRPYFLIASTPDWNIIKPKSYSLFTITGMKPIEKNVTYGITELSIRDKTSQASDMTLKTSYLHIKNKENKASIGTLANYTLKGAISNYTSLNDIDNVFQIYSAAEDEVKRKFETNAYNKFSTELEEIAFNTIWKTKVKNYYSDYSKTICEKGGSTKDLLLRSGFLEYFIAKHFVRYYAIYKRLPDEQNSNHPDWERWMRRRKTIFQFLKYMDSEMYIKICLQNLEIFQTSENITAEDIPEGEGHQFIYSYKKLDSLELEIILKILKKVREIIFHSVDFSLGDLAKINRNNDFQDLSLLKISSGQVFAKDIILVINSFNNLHTFYMENMKIDGNFGNDLKNTNLKSLSLVKCFINLKSADFFSNALLKLKLKELNLSKNKLDVEDMKNLSYQLAQLPTPCSFRLILQSCSIDINSIEPLLKTHILTSLESLDLSNNPIKDGGLHLLLKKIPISKAQLQQLVLQNCQFTNISRPTLKDFLKFCPKHLDITNNNISEDVRQIIWEKKKNDNNLDILLDFHKFDDYLLDFENTNGNRLFNIKNRVLSVVKLDKLNKCNVDWTIVKNLNFSNTELRTEKVERMTFLSKLDPEVINLSLNANLKLEDIEMIGKMKNLKKLDIAINNFDNESMTKFLSELQHVNCLKELFIFDTGITRSIFLVLLDCLTNLSHLKVLNSPDDGKHSSKSEFKDIILSESINEISFNKSTLKRVEALIENEIKSRVLYLSNQTSSFRYRASYIEFLADLSITFDQLYINNIVIDMKTADSLCKLKFHTSSCKLELSKVRFKMYNYKISFLVKLIENMGKLTTFRLIETDIPKIFMDGIFEVWKDKSYSSLQDLCILEKKDKQSSIEYISNVIEQSSKLQCIRLSSVVVDTNILTALSRKLRLRQIIFRNCFFQKDIETNIWNSIFENNIFLHSFDIGTSLMNKEQCLSILQSLNKYTHSLNVIGFRAMLKSRECENAFWEVVRKNEQLKMIDTAKNDLKNLDFKSKSIEKLILRQIKQKSEILNIKEFCSNFEKLSNLTMLSFSENGKIKDEEWLSIFETITKKCLSLKELFLYENKLRDSVAKSLVEKLQRLKKLKLLSIGNNELSNVTVQKMLQINSLTKLELIEVGLTQISGEHIERALSNLKYLNINKNNINNDSASQLLKFLRKSTNLTTLSMDNSKLTNELVIDIVQFLEYSKKLKSFSIKSNNINRSEGRKILENVVKHCSDLEYLGLDYCDIDMCLISKINEERPCLRYLNLTYIESTLNYNNEGNLQIYNTMQTKEGFKEDYCWV
ncbi:DgyrCDS3232 [Dimorphilus gyrociliatus]|uniref:DgyrCDS3232 n=1 Tax=Dimorphilus gyrociliatus TaxID=2664684 RepID=A0A7I8VD06_9ANNE|nr:DgyrCDS3232 [Dimorphilus gyrociliatus]